MSETLTPVSSYVEYWHEMSEEAARHEKARERIELRLKMFQDICKHETTQFQSDPAGGSDSCWYCTVCDKVL